MLRNVLIKKYVDTKDAQRIIGHSSVVYMNLQQDINELDRKSNGEINYDIYKARTDKDYKIKNGCGISLIDISELEDFKPEYRVIDQQKIGNCIVYRLERYYGD